MYVYPILTQNELSGKQAATTESRHVGLELLRFQANAFLNKTLMRNEPSGKQDPVIDSRHLGREFLKLQSNVFVNKNIFGS